MSISFLTVLDETYINDSKQDSQSIRSGTLKTLENKKETMKEYNCEKCNGIIIYDNCLIEDAGKYYCTQCYFKYKQSIVDLCHVCCSKLIVVNCRYCRNPTCYECLTGTRYDFFCLKCDIV